MQQISTSSDVKGRKNVLHRIADVPGGISMELASLVAGLIVNEGSPLAAPSSGLRKLCKAAKVLTGTTTSALKVANGAHHFKVGDFVCTKIGGLASAIATITTSNGVDILNLVGTIEALSAGDWIYQAIAAATGVDATLNIAYDDGTSTGLTPDATSTALVATMPGQSTEATIVGTTTEPGDATVTISSDVLAADVVVTVAIADNDTAEQAATKMRLALSQNAIIAANFIVAGELTKIILIHKALVINGSELLNNADCILKSSFEVPSASQVIYPADGLLQAVVLEDTIAPLYLAQLKGVVAAKY
jgi:hypothetical protein